MLLTLFHGSDDGFTFAGIILLLLVLLLLLPAVSSLLAARLDRNIQTLEVQHAQYEKRQAELDALPEDVSLSESRKTETQLSESWKAGGGL